MNVSFLYGVLVHGLIWQLAEPKLQAWGEKLVGWLTGKPLNQMRMRDADGIPVVMYREHGRQYNPLFVAYQAIQDYHGRSDPRKKQSFFKLTDWLVQEAEIGSDTLWMPYHFDLSQNDLKAPWYSALAQAYAVSAFARRYELSGELLWLDYCKKALNTLKASQGLVLVQSDGSYWFMEYPGAKQPYVLNGMLAILLQLDATHRITHLELARELFESGYRALLTRLPQFDYHGFSYYDLSRKVASRDYHQKHIAYLKRLHAIRPHHDLLHYALRWQLHDLLPVAAQLFWNPRPKRIAAFLLSLVGILCLIWGITKVCQR